MIKSISVILFTLLLSCSRHNSSDFTIPSNDDINKIIETLIIEDSLHIFRRDDSQFCIDLDTFCILTSPEYKRRDIYIGSILHLQVNDSLFFSSKDSLYILFQNKSLSKFRIDSSIVEKMNSISRSDFDNRVNTQNDYDVFSATLPIFSADGKKAYIMVSLSFHSKTESSGYGYEVFFEKQNGVWKKTGSNNIWMS